MRGSRHARISSRSIPWDHPRACGAHFRSFSITHDGQGSSPRMRGSLVDEPCPRRNVGIIPAHAGLTPASASSRRQRWDHPRACGAHSETLRSPSRDAGSSPRMRGSQVLAHLAARLSGIIPAHAGLTSFSRIIQAADRDHPRACGAHKCIKMRAPVSTGSSPRMRGSH